MTVAEESITARSSSDGPGPAALLRSCLPFAAVLCGWLVAYPFVDDYGNPDGPSYIVIAELWLSGEWSTAVNGYWGPLLSWAMIPLLAMGVPGLDALRIVLLGGALVTLVPLRALLRSVGASRAATEALLLATAPFLVYNALFGLYPDVFLAAVLLGTAALMARPDFVSSARTAAAVGALAAVGYLAKAYAVPVVLVFLPLGALLHGLPPTRAGWRRIGRQLALALGTFASLAGAWILVLSLSYDTPTISTSAGFNARLVGPASAGNPYNEPGLFEPPRPDALSAWEEPSRLEIPERDRDDDGAGSRSSEASHRLANVTANARIVVGSMLRRGAPIALLALVAVGGLVRRRRVPGAAFVGPLLLGAISAAGLVFIIAIERYTWVVVLALVPAAATGFDLLTRGRKVWLGVGAVVLVAAMGLVSTEGLLRRAGDYARVTDAAGQLDTSGEVDGARVATLDSWQETHLLCFRVGCQYLGTPREGSVEDVAAELRDARATHLLVWAGDGDDLSGLPPPEVGVGLAVYRVEVSGLDLQSTIRLRR